MFVKFLITLLIIGTAGPGHNEGGFAAVEAKGAKAAIEQAYKERQPYDATSLKGTLGNYGNQ